MLVAVVTVVFALRSNKGDASLVAEIALRAGQIGAEVGAGLVSVIQPYTEGVGDAAAAGGPANYANPVYAHNQNFDGHTYAEVDDGPEYEEPNKRQSELYAEGKVLGADRQCVQMTSSGRCTGTAPAGLQRCEPHTCSTPGCTNSKSSKAVLCKSHEKEEQQSFA